MAKKLPTKIRPEHLDAFADHVTETATALKAQAEVMRVHHFDEIEVGAWQQTARGRKFIDAFLTIMRDAIAQARSDRGDLPPLPFTGRKKKDVPDSGKKRPGK
jgi:hypothetical protein